MSIESLKQQARKHEQNEDWKKALDQYKKALTELARDDQVDIGLYNRVGDLFVRVGQLDEAVDHYEKAVELYREAYLPNNAIAVCKKIIRNVPNRHRAYLVIGQIRAEQGFLPDARTNFLTYAERMQQDGDLDESFRALVELCDLAPDDIGVRVTVADQMAANGRADEAVEQLVKVYGHYKQLGDQNQAEDIKTKIFQLDPDANLDLLPTTGGYGGSSMSDDGEMVAGFGEISLGGDAFGDSSDEEISFASQSAIEEASTESVDGDFDLGGDDFDLGSDSEESEALPMMGFEEEEADADPLPTLGFEEEPDEEEEDQEADPLPMLGFDDDDAQGEEEAEPLPMLGFDDDDDASIEEAVEDATDEGETFELEPTPPEPPLPDVSSPAAAAPPSANPPSAPETSAAPAPPAAPPSAPSSKPADQGYVDLGAMILGGGREKSTRFTVAYEEPSGDEDADFAKMLSQFKEKVTENLDSSDVRAHYDLGTAYKEMGLLDEAISSFQAALRASADHLPTYELMGQTFIEMGQPEAAVRSLERAVESADTVEDELVGIYYYLGRAYEALDNRASAVEFYDRVFALDINFADVTERLRELR
jgi:tetratricopeptide (TPR) repeat protein